MYSYRLPDLIVMTTVLLLIITAGVLAEDTTAPTIIHEEIVEAPADTTLSVETEVKDESRIQRVTLFMRSKGTNEYYKLPAKGKADGSYKAIIPSNFMAVGTLEYYLRAVDVKGNISTYPELNAAGDPLEISVKPDETIPEATLMAPKGMIGDDSFAVVIVLDDEAANIDPESAEVFFNGKNISSNARISKRSIAFQVPARDIDTKNKILIRISDKAGNELEKTFKISQHPLVSGSYSTDMTFAEDGTEIESSLGLKASWGRFSATADISGENLYFEDADSEYNLSYDGRLLDLSLIDTDTTLSEMTASSYSHRGADIKFKLGPFNSVYGYGYAQPAIKDEQFARKFFGMRQAYDFGFMNGGFNFSEVIDEANGEEIEALSPEQNYVMSMDNGLYLFGLSVESELAASFYFDNASDNIWNNVDALVNSLETLGIIEEDEKDDIRDTLNDVPDIVKKLFPLPLDATDITSITQYFTALDFAGKIGFNTPLPWSDLSATYYYYGPYFKTLAGSGDRDAQGYNLSFATDRFFDFVDMSLDYGQYRDNIDYITAGILADILSDDDTPEESGEGAVRYTEYDGELGIYTALFDTDLGYSHEEEADFDTLVLQTDEDTYSVKLKNIKFDIGEWESSVKTSFSTAKENEYDNTGLNVTNWKKTDKSRINFNMEKGLWEHGLTYRIKNETDKAGAELQSPSYSISNSWSKKDLNFANYSLYKFEVESDITITNTDGDTEDEEEMEYEIEFDIRPTKNMKFVVGYTYTDFTDNLDASNNSTENEGKIKYSIDF